MIIENFTIQNYKFGCVFLTYNRVEKIYKSIESINKSFIPDDFLLVVVDDGSEEKIDIKTNCNHVIINKNKNYGISNGLVLGWDYIYNMYIPYMLNLDSDVILSKNWLSQIMRVHKSEKNKNITTGFNGKFHKIIEDNDKFYTKNSIGGINILFDRSTYPEIRPCLTEYKTIPKKENLLNSLENYGKNPKIHNIYSGWDWGLMKICDDKNIKKICTKPSVVQHIGDVGFTSDPKNFEQCLDFQDVCVPKIIHQTWKDNNIPEHLKIMQESVIDKHKDYEYMFWTDESINVFIKENYPDLWEFYNSFMYNIQKIDFARLLFLYHYGGIYIDLDSYCYKNVDSILNFPISLVKAKLSECYTDHYSFILNNAFIASEKRNLFIKNVLENILKFKMIPDYESKYIGHYEYATVLMSAGPLMITDSYVDYEFKNMITILDEEFYFGITQNQKEEFLNKEHNYNFLHIHESSWWKKHGRAVMPAKNPNRKSLDKIEVSL